MGSHFEQIHAKVKACAWEDLSGSNGENGSGAVRLETYCNDPTLYHETPERESSSRTGKAVQSRGIPEEEQGQSRVFQGVHIGNREDGVAYVCFSNASV